MSSFNRSITDDLTWKHYAAGAATLGAVGLGTFLNLRFKTCAPNQYLVRTGLGIRDMLVSKSGVQWRSVAFSGVQWRSVAFSGVQWRSVAFPAGDKPEIRIWNTGDASKDGDAFSFLRKIMGSVSPVMDAVREASATGKAK
jgi:hypothetical protein